MSAEQKPVSFISKVPMTKTLDALLNPTLFDGQPIFTHPLEAPCPTEKVYELAPADVLAIRQLRGAVVDLHPGMGGVAPEKLISMIKEGKRLTSLDYMLTRGCNFECTWCFASSGPGKRQHLPFSVLEKVTDEAVSLGVSLFVLTGGEPLVYRDPTLGKGHERGDHFFRVIDMIHNTASRYGISVKILTFDDVALITQRIAERFAAYGVGLCTKGDTLHAELQDFKVNQVGAFKKMQRGYENLIQAGYGHQPGQGIQNPSLRVVVNSVLDHTTFDGMVDLHFWVMEHGFDHSIVPVHYCGAAENERQEAGIHSPHVAILYRLLARIDERYFGVTWKPWSAFPYNKTCNRNRSGLHIRADGDVTACSESPGKEATERFTFGNVFDPAFSLRALVKNDRLAAYRREFAAGYGTFVCSPDRCDLYKNDLCQGGCATRSAYSKIEPATGLITKNLNPHNYSEHREDPLCPAWSDLALQQGILRPDLLEGIHERLTTRSTRIHSKDFPFELWR